MLILVFGLLGTGVSHGMTKDHQEGMPSPSPKTVQIVPAIITEKLNTERVFAAETREKQIKC